MLKNILLKKWMFCSFENLSLLQEEIRINGRKKNKDSEIKKPDTA